MATIARSDFTGSDGAALGAEWTSARATGSSTTDIQSNRGRWVTSATGGYTDGIVRRLAFGTVTNGDLYFKFEVPNLGEAFGQVWFRADSTCGVNGYFFSMEPSYNTLRFYRRVSGVQTALGSAVSFTFAPNTEYSARVQWSGSTLRAKFWASGAEPGSWTVSTTDSSHSGAGYVGAGLDGGNLATARTCYYDTFVLTDDGVIGQVGEVSQAITASATLDGLAGNAATQAITAGVTATGAVGAAGAVSQAATAGVTATGGVGAAGAVAQAITAGATVTGDVAAPAFPRSPLPVTVELQLGGDWVDVTQWTYGRDSVPISITRGLTAEGGTLDRSTCQLSFDNRDGRFSPRNPMGPYYGLLGRNTPLRVTLEEGGPYLLMPGGTGDQVTAPDTAGISVTGDLDVRIDLWADNWAATGDLIGKYRASGDQRSWALRVSGGYLEFRWSEDGTSLGTATVTSTVRLPLQGPGRMAVRVTLDVDDGGGAPVITFYLANTIDGPWREHFRHRGVSVTQIYNSTAPLEIGQVDGSNLATAPLAGRLYAAEVRSGLDGTLVANPVFSDQVIGATTIYDQQGNTYTLAGDTELTNRHTRFYGEVSEWPQKWDTTGRDAWVPVTASGIIRRLSQGASPVQSTMRRHIATLPAVVAYWPLEDGKYTDRPASPMTGVQAMTVTGTASFASNTGFPGSAPLPALKSARLDAAVPSHTATGQEQVRFLVAVPDGGTTDQSIPVRVWTSGTVGRWDLVYSAFGGSFNVKTYDQAGAAIATSGAVSFALDGATKWVALEMTQNGSNVDWTLSVLDFPTILGLFWTGTLTGRTLGTVTKVSLNPTQNFGDASIGHLTVENDVTSIFDVSLQLNAWREETCGRRMRRLCEENGIDFRLIGYEGLTVRAGYQLQKTLLELLREAATADGGLLHEPADRLGFVYRSRETMQRQSPVLTLSYPGHQLRSLEPVEDDRYLRNDVKVVREGGGEASAALVTGALSVQAPPDGVGRYDSSVTLTLGNDAEAVHQASWRLHLGTVDEPRYPTLWVSLAHPSITSRPDLVRQALTVDIGDRVVVEDPPQWVPPDPISQIVIGYTERLGQFMHDITWVLQPESPYRVAIHDDTGSRYSPDVTSTLATAVTTPQPVRRGIVAAGGEWGVTGTGVSASPFPGTYGVDWKYPSAGSIAYLASRGITTIRLPFTWERIQPTRHGALDTSEVTRITAVLDECAAHGISVFLEPQSFGRYRESGGSTVRVFGTDLKTDELVDLWIRVVQAFGGHTALLGWELCNEPHDFASSPAATGGELLTNGGFESGTTGWTTTNGSITTTATNPHSGSNALQLTASGAGSAFAKNSISVTAGSTYAFAGWVRASTGVQVRVGVSWFNAGWSYLSGTSYGAVTATTTWQRQSFTATAPVGAAYGQIELEIVSAAGGEVAYFDDASIRATASISGAVLWQNITQDCVTAIRALGDEHLIYVPGYDWQSAANWATNHPTPWITDPAGNFRYSAHLYFDTDHSGTYAQTFAQETTDAIGGGHASVQARTLARLTVFTGWLATNSVRGAVTELGWPHYPEGDAASWDAVGEAVYDALDAGKVDATYWAVSDLWGRYYGLAPYDDSGSAAGVLDTAWAQAPTVEAHPGTGLYHDTLLSVATASGALWSHSDGDFDVIAGGERMTVTAITGSSSPQTFTVTRAVNGVLKAHDAGEAVELFEPVYYGLGSGL